MTSVLEKIVYTQKAKDSVLFDDGIYRIKKCKSGNILFNIRDLYLNKALDFYGEFSPGETELFEKMINPGDVVIDAGANIGAHTLDFSRIVGDKGSVYAFEPQPTVFNTLCTNLLLNDIHNVQKYQLGVGAKEGSFFTLDLDIKCTHSIGSLPLMDPLNGSLKKENLGSRATLSNGNSSLNGTLIEVDVVTIDNLNLIRCDFIKVDVEGMEQNVLQGAQETINKHKPILYVECDLEDKAKDLQGYIASLNYEMYWHLTTLVDLKNNYYDCHENCFDNMYSSFNLLCLPKDLKKAQSKEIKVSNLYCLNPDPNLSIYNSIGEPVQKIII
jgi:FkbM family methyltransferase